MAFLLSSKNYMELLLRKDKKEGSDEIGASLHYFLAAARARTMGTIFFILLLCDRTEEMIISDSVRYEAQIVKLRFQMQNLMVYTCQNQSSSNLIHWNLQPMLHQALQCIQKQRSSS